jgi:hypothetical protein
MLRDAMKKLIPGGVRRKIKTALTGSVLPVNECIRVGARFVCWNQIPGDYLEFGSYSGSSFCYAHQAFQHTRKCVMAELTAEDRRAFEGARPRFFTFDSFEGLPEAIDVDAHPYMPKHWKNATFSMGVGDFQKILSKNGVDKNDVHIVAGWYRDTLTDDTKAKYHLQKAAMVHVDCDYYESALAVLDFVTDLVDDGTVVVFDDYNCFRGSPELGERRAFSEWLARNPHIKATELARHDFHSVAFFLNLTR